MPKLQVVRHAHARRPYELKDAVRVSREELRTMIHTGIFGEVAEGSERMIKRMRNVLISAALLDGRDVLCVESPSRQVLEELNILAVLHGAEFVYEGPPVKRKTLDAPPSRIQRYEPDTRLPKAVIVDIDGTVAKHVKRSPYDYNLVQTDAPKHDVIRIVHALRDADNRIIFVSGRPDHCRAATELWLDRHIRDWDELHMRATGDTRNDALVKLDIFDAEIRDRFNVVGVLDDRDRVVRMWRTLGLTTLQVGDGAF